MGKIKKPTKLKKMQGTLQKCRVLPNEFEPPVMKDFEPPYPLNKWGMEEWNRIIGILKDAEVITEVDRSALYVLCHQFGKYMEAEHMLEKEERVVKNRVNAWENLSQRAFKAYKDMIIQFGLTPSSRARVPQGKKDKDDIQSILKAI